ncbi:MAG: hypothetical protein OER88_14250 [Planctomycetota bacterium]|nr:hypothetical protein [Planctomycetota bacterium]
MTGRPLPRGELPGAALLLTALAAALFLVEAAPGAGPLGLCTAVAVVHAAWLAPALGRGAAAWGALPLLLALPAWAASSYGHAWGVRLWALALIAAAAACGASGRRAPRALYLATVAVALAVPFFLGHLVVEFGSVAQAARWETSSPLIAALRVARGHAPWIALLVLAAWPVVALAPRRRA